MTRQAPQMDKRCEATRKPLEDGTLAQCMRAKAKGDPHFCPGHRKEAEERVAAGMAVLHKQG